MEGHSLGVQCHGDGACEGGEGRPIQAYFACPEVFHLGYFWLFSFFSFMFPFFNGSLFFVSAFLSFQPLRTDRFICFYFCVE
jgi:hypothetical protein